MSPASQGVDGKLFLRQIDNVQPFIRQRRQRSGTVPVYKRRPSPPPKCPARLAGAALHASNRVAPTT